MTINDDPGSHEGCLSFPVNAKPDTVRFFPLGRMASSLNSGLGRSRGMYWGFGGAFSARCRVDTGIIGTVRRREWRGEKQVIPGEFVPCPANYAIEPGHNEERLGILLTAPLIWMTALWTEQDCKYYWKTRKLWPWLWYRFEIYCDIYRFLTISVN